MEPETDEQADGEAHNREVAPRISASESEEDGMENTDEDEAEQPTGPRLLARPLVQSGTAAIPLNSIGEVR